MSAASLNPDMDDDDRMETDDDEEVLLRLPGRPEFVKLVRVAASGLASRLGFSWDEVEDLRLAVDELCYAVLDGQSGQSALCVRYRMVDRSLEVEGHLEHPAAAPVTISELSLSQFGDQILSALVDEHAIRAENPGQPALWIRKSRMDPPR